MDIEDAIDAAEFYNEHQKPWAKSLEQAEAMLETVPSLLDSVAHEKALNEEIVKVCKEKLEELKGGEE